MDEELPPVDHQEQKHRYFRRVSEKERRLMDQEIITMERVKSQSANVVYVVTLDDGSQAIFKPQAGENNKTHPRVDKLYLRERAAYVVSDRVGFGLVPTTVIREINEETGSLQEFIPNTVAKNEIPILLDPATEIGLQKLWVLDLALHTSDRTPENILIDKDNHGEIWAIDNGFSLADEGRRVDTAFWGKQLSQEVKNIFKNYSSNPTIRRDLLLELKSILPDEKDVEACLARLDLLAKLIEHKGQIDVEDAIAYWPGKNISTRE